MQKLPDTVKLRYMYILKQRGDHWSAGFREHAKLYGYIVTALEEQQTTRARYDMICKGLIQYQEEFPFYFKMVLDKINVDFKDHDYLPEEKATYHVGKKSMKNERIFSGRHSKW